MAFGVFVCVHARVQGETPARQTCYVACRLCLPLLLMFRLYLFKYFELIFSGRGKSGSTKGYTGTTQSPPLCSHTHPFTHTHARMHARVPLHRPITILSQGQQITRFLLLLLESF